MAEQESKQGIDVGQQQVGAVYAKALLGAAASNIDSVLDELQSIVEDVLASNAQINELLASPRIPLEAKVAVIDKAFKGADKILVNFLKVVAQHGRLDCLQEIYRSARHLANSSQGRVAVQVKTAEPLTDALRDQVAGQLKNLLKTDVVVEAETDPDLIGGMVVRVGDTVYDGSIANRLQKLRRDALARSV